MSGYCELCGEKVCVCTNEPIVTNAMVQRDLQDEIDKLDHIARELQDTCHKQAQQLARYRAVMHQPLTDEELLVMWAGDNPRPVLGKNKVLAYARAIEQAHGITGEEK